jgi:phosphoglycerate dehydrogenase-like enzyme
MTQHPTLFLTHRAPVHQQKALEAAPSELDVSIHRDLSKTEIIRLLPGVEFLISEREDLIDAEILAAGQNLRLIQRLGSQTWDIDLEAARKANIAVCRWPVRSCIAVAEHVMMQILSVTRHTRKLMQLMNKAIWQMAPTRCDEDTFAYNWTGQEQIFNLWQKKVGILGLGEIGAELASRLKGFDCRVLYNKRRPLPVQAEQNLQITYATQTELVCESDVLCSLLPFSKGTEQTLNSAYFAQMKPGAYFVHSGGSAVVDEQALIEVLRSGHLAGAALDTFTWEPIPHDHPLLELARDPHYNLILTPHIAAGTFEKGWRKEDYTNLLNILNGKPLLYRVV